MNKGTGVRGNLLTADQIRLPIILCGDLIPGRKKTNPINPTIPKAKATLTPENNNTRRIKTIRPTAIPRLIVVPFVSFL